MSSHGSNALIKDVFSAEVNAIATYLYVKMQGRLSQKNAVKAWDNFEELINRPINDEESLLKVLALFEVSNKQNLTNIDLNGKKVRQIVYKRK